MSAETSGVLEVRELCKRYPGFALADVSFTLPRGYMMGLIGPNGAGKTTTLKLILGLLRRDGGAIRAFGLDPARQGAAVRSRIGFVHDEPHFYRHLTLADNAALVARFYRTWDAGSFRRHADAFGLPLDKRFGQLSHGNRTKFALALALSHRAELVVLDEPTSGLDPVFRRDLLDTLSELLQDEQTSILFSTHITSDLERIADYITLIQNGRIVFSAAKDEILKRWGLVKGGLELLERLPPGYFRGIRRGAHGFEALTDDAAAARRQLGDSALIEVATLDDIVLYTTGSALDA
ncbi:MAG: sodium ABC transporter ATP-binding protein [Gemmatimonas sp. SM23_52]|nr:MAG: sodium ABC transporter ATP-binding protein [Gemmatimonas sp. SM23_52]